MGSDSIDSPAIRRKRALTPFIPYLPSVFRSLNSAYVLSDIVQEKRGLMDSILLNCTLKKGSSIDQLFELQTGELSTED